MKRRKLFYSAVAVFMSFAFPMTAMAADHDAGNFDELKYAFDNDTDAEVNITLTDSIDCGGETLTANEGQSYNISNSDGNDYHMSDVSLDGAGSVAIEADINGAEEGAALSVSGDVQVTVTGDITSEGDGVYAEEGSEVTVTGDITAGSDGVYAEEGSEVTVTGDITAGSDGVYADGSTVSVEGNIDAEDDGVYAKEGSEVTVTGDITAGSDGVYAYEGSEVTVTGDITAEDDGVEAYGSTVSVEGNIDAEDDGVSAFEGSEVTVTGDITSGYYGVYADGSTVSVEGSIDAEDDGVYAYEGSEVTVTGDITAEDDGVEAYGSTVSVEGNIYAEEIGVAAYEGSEVTVTESITAGETDVDKDEGSKVTVMNKGSISQDTEAGTDTDVSIHDKTVVPLSYGDENSQHFWVTYTVQRGDTLTAIAQRYGCTVADIMAANSELIKDANRILTGWELQIPQMAEGAGKVSGEDTEDRLGIVYVVQKGDTLWGISRKYRCTIADIVAANSTWIKNPDLILPGWELWIPAE
ncbi:MAG: LysM peptidoglycan-binding domain-containing protein [Lachnospiraceae bacterium]|nr:LysM peptidoglycan-binding domain-containing protein [Lachnospiraceae bacterium]